MSPLTLFGYFATYHGIESISNRDNQSANALAHNAEYHSRTKHIHGRQRFITEMVEQRVIGVTYIPTRDIVADMSTKALLRDAY